MQKKVLIMSASTGGGHNRAARAIKEELTNKSVNGITIDCEIIDSLKIVNGTMDKLISRGYEKSAKYTPKAWGGVYKLTETNLISRNEFKDNPLTSLVSRKLKKLKSKNHRFFVRNQMFYKAIQKYGWDNIN